MPSQKSEDKQYDRVVAFVCPACNTALGISVSEARRRFKEERKSKSFIFVDCACGQKCVIDRRMQVSKFCSTLPNIESIHEHY